MPWRKANSLTNCLKQNHIYKLMGEQEGKLALMVGK